MKVRGAVEQNEDGRISIRRLTLNSPTADKQHLVVFSAPLGAYSRNELAEMVPGEAQMLWREIAEGYFTGAAPFLCPSREAEFIAACEAFLSEAVATYPAGAFRGPD